MDPPAAAYDADDDQLQRQEDDVAAGPSVEQVFEGEPVPTLSEMITARSVTLSVVLGITLSVVAIKLTLASVYIPFLTIPAGFLGFFLSRLWARLLHGCESAQLPFNRQENTVIQTFVVACSNIAYSGTYAPEKNAA